jgi:uncharacterized glyoxalase superfamily protein PhnB
VIPNRSAPAATVVPVLVYPDVREAVAWLTAALGFRERVRIGAGHRAQLQVGADAAVIVAQAHAEQQPPSGVVSSLLKVRVADVDEAFRRALACGARVVQEPVTQVYGERECTVADLAGHRWQLTQTMRDVAPEEWGGQTVGQRGTGDSALHR